MISFLKRFPKLPLSALFFYALLIGLWKLGHIPSPVGILKLLEDLYVNYGLAGMVFATFLEGIVYLGLYFPGSFIIALAVFLSDGTFTALLNITALVTATLTLTALINYWLGRYVVSKEAKKEALLVKSKALTRGLVLSVLHPNLLAFYFFGLGLNKGNFNKILIMPALLFPYGLALAYLLSVFSESAKHQLENPNTLLILLIIWFMVAFVSSNKRK